ncbi:helix-turn-helix transcriptional regulator [Litoreibacter albidus]|uniref:AraC-type DNA-binding protein n=1 Tax=Litoreibacter albidus TaxID=670155 RepID=A0A1H3DGT1_9RHOB|nr:AraC family transcriptional regulator [Litoreibacter albidus]SDX65567.1 AraC-type DNA-binding protein [Litoreibacter albidus]
MNPSLLDVRFLHADNSDYGEEWSGTRLNDDYHRLYHIVSGSAQVRYDGHDCTLTEGCSYLFPPTAHFSYRCPNYLSLQNVCFKMTVLGGVDVLKLQPSLFKVVRPDEDNMTTTMASLHDALGEAMTFADQITAHGRLFQLLAPHFAIDETAQDRTRRQSVVRLMGVLDYISKNLRSSIKVADLPDRAGMSRSHFVRSFTEALGMSPQAYIRRRRIELVKVDLRATQKSLALLSYETGFSSPSHLTREFRKLTGYTPNDYRRLDQPFE